MTSFFDKLYVPPSSQEACLDTIHDVSSNADVQDETVSASEMCDMIDIVMVKISETSKWQDMPPAPAARVIAELKEPYNANPEVLSSPTQAVALMELTGRKLGEALVMSRKQLIHKPMLK